jgi:hypothetical protein
MRCKLNAVQFGINVISWQPSKGFLVTAAGKLSALWREKNEVQLARKAARAAADAKMSQDDDEVVAGEVVDQAALVLEAALEEELYRLHVPTRMCRRCTRA